MYIINSIIKLIEESPQETIWAYSPTFYQKTEHILEIHSDETFHPTASSNHTTSVWFLIVWFVIMDLFFCPLCNPRITVGI